MPLELLAITDADAPPPDLPMVEHGGLRAVLAEAEASRAVWLPGAARRQLIAAVVRRQERLEALHRTGPVLAARPAQGIDRAMAETLLVAHRAALHRALAETGRAVQVQVSISWPPEAVFARFGEEPELRAGPAGAAALAARLRREFQDRLRAHARDSIDLPREDPAKVLLTMALLLEPREMAPLETALEEIDALWPEGFSIRLVGPSPALSFAGLALRWPKRAEIAGAAATLGVPIDADPDGVTRAIRAKLSGGRDNPDAVAAYGVLSRVAAARAALAAGGGDPAAVPPLIDILRDDTAAPARTGAAA